MKRRLLLFIIAIPIVLITAIVQIGLWDSYGGLFTFLSGQSAPSIDLEKFRDAPLRSSSESYEVVVRRKAGQPVHSIGPDYISFAVDSSQVVGGKWWNPEASTVEQGSGSVHSPVFAWDHPVLNKLSAALSPAYLRIGGSEADKIFYDMESDAAIVEGAPEGYHSTMTRKQWDDVNSFARRHNFKLVMCLNVGPSSRDENYAWQLENAASLIDYSKSKGYRVAIWEMGNELNLFWYVYGGKFMVQPEQYHNDLLIARKYLEVAYPESRFAGQGSAFWPVLGEPLQFFYGYQAPFLKRSGGLVDVVSWHFYPQQSRRGPIASRRAYPGRMLEPENLNEVAHWGAYVRGLRDQHAPGASLWVGETGNAQFGGEPGVSDAYIGGLWWLDQLGVLARLGHDVIVRQTLSGMNYGMIDYDSMQPRPDYWNSLLWKKLMTGEVFDVQIEGDQKLRAYWHAAGDGAGETVLLINLDHQRAVNVKLPQLSTKRLLVYLASTGDVLGQELRVNGQTLKTKADGSPPDLLAMAEPLAGGGEVQIAPLAYAFIVAR